MKSLRNMQFIFTILDNLTLKIKKATNLISPENVWLFLLPYPRWYGLDKDLDREPVLSTVSVMFYIDLHNTLDRRFSMRHLLEMRSKYHFKWCDYN